MLSLVVLSLAVAGVAAQPFQRLTTALGSAPSTGSPFGVSSPSAQILTPQVTTPQLTSPYTTYTPDQLGSSTLTFPQSLNQQLNIPNTPMNQISFNDPFAQATAPATPNTGSLSSILPSGLGNSINSITSPFTTALSGPAGTTQTSPVTSTLSNLFGSAPTTTQSNSPFGTTFAQPAQPTSTNLFPIDSSNMLFPSSFSNPVTTQSQAPSQLSTFSSQPPNVGSFPQAPTQPQAPRAPSSPFSSSAPVAPSSSAFVPPTGFNSAAINPPATPNSPDFNIQAPRLSNTSPFASTPSLSNSSPFSSSSPALPSSPVPPSSPVAPSQPQLQQPGFPQQPGPVLFEAGSSTTKPVASVVLSRAAPVVATSSVPAPPFPITTAHP